MLPLFFIMLTSLNGFAAFDEAMLRHFNEDYERVEQLRNSSNPESRSLEEIIAEKNAEFLKNVKGAVNDKQFEVIDRGLKSINATNARSIEKSYLDKISTKEKNSLPDGDKEFLNELMTSSNKLLKKDVVFKTPTKVASQGVQANSPAHVQKDVANESMEKLPGPSKPQDEESLKQHKLRKDILKFSEERPKDFETSEEDSLFERVTKAYFRNLKKIVPEN